MSEDEIAHDPLSKELLESVGELASELNRQHAACHNAETQPLYPALSILVPPAFSAPNMGVAIMTAESKDVSITTPAPAQPQEIRRVMRPITDTRLARMGQPVVRTPAPSATPDKPAAASAPQEPKFATLPKIPAALNRRPTKAARAAIPMAKPGTRVFLLGANHDAASFAVDEQRAAPASAAAIAPPPLPTPLPPPAAAPAGNSIDDITAALLRPMLKRWVEDNMQALVTLALHRETGLGGKAGKPGA